MCCLDLDPTECYAPCVPSAYDLTLEVVVFGLKSSAGGVCSRYTPFRSFPLVRAPLRRPLGHGAV